MRVLHSRKEADVCKAVDVASYILQEKGRLTGYQLQKLLYYSHAWCLVTQGRPLFEEEVRAWGYGPVVCEVYREHARQYTVTMSDLTGDPSRLTPSDAAVVDAVLDSYGDLTGEQIEDLSHHEDPWRRAYDGTSTWHSPVISDEATADYYSALLASDKWTIETHHVPHFSFAPRIPVSVAEYDWLATLA
jgi:uncharacterized phage-associated protein